MTDREIAEYLQIMTEEEMVEEDIRSILKSAGEKIREINQ